MKKILLFLLGMCLFSAPLQAQGKTRVVVLGKNKGNVASLRAAGHTLLDVRATTKKLGGTVELFSTSKQIKVAFPGMYAVLGAGQKEAVLGVSVVKLPAEVIASGGRLYAPAEFFMLPAVQKALDRQIILEDGALVVEKNYTLAYSGSENKASYSRLKLQPKGGVSFHVNKPNKHTLEAVFPSTVLKRNVQLRLKNDFIRSFTLSQRGKDVVLKVILGKKGKEWRLADENGMLVLSVAAKTLPDPEASSASQPSGPEEDDAQELDLSPSVIRDDMTASERQPVFKPAPQPVITAVPGPVIQSARTMRIMVDPGHGGKDPGAVRRGSSKEKDLNLAVAKHLYNYLKKRGFDVKMTRDNDTFVTLGGRSKHANQYKADLFVSVHTNAAKRSAANGFEVYFRSDKATDAEAAEVAAFENEALQYEETHYNFVDMLLQSLAKTEYMNESSKVAGHIRNYVYKEPGIGIAVRQNGAIRQANFYVLKGVQAPAVLVEMGYISSPKDRARLNNKAVQKRMGEAIAKGIVSYAKAEGRMK